MKTGPRPKAAKKRSYHHGDARAALIQAGLKILSERAVDDLSLREVARAAGVSATAVYRHFADKDALLRALSIEGFEQLAHAQRTAAAGAASELAAFDATGYAYVRFARDNPALFRLMFSSYRPIDMMSTDSQGDAFDMLRNNARKLSGGSLTAEADIATRAWAMVHGLATLLLDNQITLDDASIKRILDSSSGSTH